MLLTNAAEQRGPFAKAKVQLILNHPFFSVLACHLPCVPMDARLMIAMGCPPTAMVDGRKIYYNPVWVEKLTERERLGLLAHEVLHPALGQLWRRGNRNRRLWMMATDYVVNDIILRTKVKNALGQEVQAFDLPKPYLYEARFTGMSAEQVYAILDKEEKEEEEKSKKSGQSKPKDKKEALDGQMEKPVEGDDDKKSKKDKKKGKKGEGKKDEKDEAGGGKGQKPDAPKQDKPDADGEGEGDEEEDEQDGEEGKGDGKGKPKPEDEDGEAEGDGEGDTDGDESDADEGDGEGEGADGESDGDEDGESEGSGAGDAKGEGDEADGDSEGGEGEASLDQCKGDKTEYECDHNHADLEDADGDLQDHWKGLLNQAAIAAKGRGNLPAQLERLVEEVNEPKVAWQQIIESRVNDVCRDDYDMLVRDRRFRDIYFPELQANATHIAVFVDTSGSIGEKEIKAFVSEIVGILRCRGIKSVRIMACDDKLTLDVTISPTDEIPDNYPGGGGTDFRPPFKRLIDEPNGDRPALVIYLTDMCGTFPDKDPGFETIWLAACPPWQKPEQLPQPNFGTVIPYDFMMNDEDE